VTKYRAWRCFSVIVTLSLILGVAAVVSPAQPASAQDGNWAIETVDDIEVISTSLALDSQDYPHISYSSGDFTSLHYARWAGTAWAKQTVDPIPVWTSSLALDSNDNPHIGYSGLIDLKYAYSAGGAWTTESLFPGPPGPIIVWDCSLALDSGNQPHMSYSLIVPGGPFFALFYTYHTDTGWQWTPPVDDTFAFSSSLALDRNDSPRISYTDIFDYSLMYAEWTGTDWELQSVDPDNPGAVISTSLALDSNDRPNIAYADLDVDGSLRYARWTGTAWVRETVDPSAYAVDCSLALDSLNHPHICYLVLSENFFSDGDGDDVVVGTLKYAHWTGSSWDIQTVDQEAAVMDSLDMKTLDQKADILKEKVAAPDIVLFFGGKFSSIAVDSSDHPHISYGSILPGSIASLHYAHIVTPVVHIPTTAHPPVSPPLTRFFNPPQMSVQFLNVNPLQASANQPVTVATNVVNTGDEAGNYNVDLKINGQVEQSRMVSVGPHASQQVKFTVTKDQPGTYNVDIVNQKGSFTILGDSESNGATSPKTGALVAMALIGILIIAALVVLLLRRA